MISEKLEEMFYAFIDFCLEHTIIRLMIPILVSSIVSYIVTIIMVKILR